MSKDMNAKMKEVAPELASPYARYPMKRARWLGLTENDPDGKPMFCPVDGTDTKPDYVRGKGPNGEGFYHLLNPHAYKNLHVRLHNQAPAQCCVCTKACRQHYDDFHNVQQIVYNRSVASKPDDGLGAKEALSISQVTANNAFLLTQI